MSQTPERLAADFDRIAALSEDSGWSHNDHYHDVLLRHLPQHMGSALDIGCGKGRFARLLAQHADQVTGIDLSAKMIESAKTLSADTPNIQYRLGDMMTMDFPVASFDCIASIATLHHLPLDAALRRIKSWLKPGGLILVLDLVKSEPSNYWMDAVAIPLNRIYKLAYRSGTPSEATRAEVNAAWDAHGKDDHYLKLSEVKRICAEILPGAQVKRHLFWRYSLIWQSP